MRLLLALLLACGIAAPAAPRSLQQIKAFNTLKVCQRIRCRSPAATTIRRASRLSWRLRWPNNWASRWSRNG